GDDVLRVRDSDVGLSLVVEGNQLDLEALLREVALELFDGELCAELDALAEGRLTAAEGALGGDLDSALAGLRLQLGRRNQRHGQNREERENEADPVTDHRCPP